MITFRTQLYASGNNVGIVVPEDIVLSFNRGKRVPVVVTIDGDYTYRSSIASMGGRFLITFNAAVRAETGRGGGDEVEVGLEVDDAPRTVDIPPALAAVLSNDLQAAAAWDALSYSNRKRHATAIDSAKTEETRQRRVAQIVAELGG